MLCGVSAEKLEIRGRATGRSLELRSAAVVLERGWAALVGLRPDRERARPGGAAMLWRPGWAGRLGWAGPGAASGGSRCAELLRRGGL